MHALDHSDLVICSVHEPRHEAAPGTVVAPAELEVLKEKKEEAPAAGAAKPDAKKDEKKK